MAKQPKPRRTRATRKTQPRTPRASAPDLHELADRLRLVVKAANVGLFDWDLQTDRCYFSAEWKRQLGYDDAEIGDRIEEWSSRVHPEDLARLQEQTRRHHDERRGEWQGEFRMRHRDGSWRWLLTQVAAMYDARGRPVRMLGAHLDITDRKRSEELLRQGEDRHRRLVEGSPVGIFITDIRGGVTYVNPRIEQLTGYSREFMLREGWHDILHPDNRERVIATWGEAVAQGVSVELEVHVRRPDGGDVWLQSSAQPEVDADGNVSGFIGTVSDITENKRAEFALKASEERFRAMVDSSPAAVFLADTSGEVTYSNPACLKILGIDASDAGGSGWMEALHPEAREEGERQWRAAMKSGQPWAGIGRFQRRDGREVWCDVRTAPIRVDGRLVGYVCMGVDVTEQRRAERELRESGERYRMLFDRNPNPMCVYDRETLRFLDVNDAMVAHYGYSRDEFLTMDIRDIRPPEDVPALLQAVQQVSDDLYTAGVFRHRKKNGELIDVEVRSRMTVLFGRKVVLALLSDVTERRRAEQALTREQAALRELTLRLNHLLATSPTVLYSTRVQGDRMTPLWISDSITRLLGYTPQEAVQPEWWRAHLHPDDKPRVLATIPELLRKGELVIEYRFIGKDGGSMWIRDECRQVRRDGSDEVEIVGAWSDISQRRVTEERLRLDAAAIESTRDGVMITGEDARIVSVNRSFRETMGYERDELIGQNPRLFQSGRHGPDFFRALWQDLNGNGHWQGEIWNRRKNGEIFPVWVTISAVYNDLGKPTHFVAVYTDISKLKQSEEELEHLAHFDPLTDLPNRLLLQSRLEHAVDQAERRERLVGVLFIDLDDFKKVNDSLGHVIGDELLVAVARRLSGRVRGEDTLARLGGDEFVVLLEDLGRAEDAATVARDLIAALASPFSLSSGPELYVQASIGISIFPDDAASPAELLRDADTAMYRAKDGGGNRFLYFTGDMSVQVLADLELENALRQAIERNELLLHFQPKLDFTSDRISGAEALLRWQRGPERMVSPNEFIPIAEKTGLIVPIGKWVIDTALAQLRQWLDQGLPELRMAVNVSALQFRSGDLDSVVAALLSRHRLPAQLLSLELTESMLMEHPEETTRILRRLKRIGVQLALDDFGTGFSSLAYLTRFPIDTLKIDRSFVRGIGHDESAMTVINSVIELAHRMHLRAVAEGVETEAQYRYMKERNCDTVQGYFISRPLPAAEFAELLKNGRRVELQ